ncbi:FERM domain-containing protein [Dirofilaria immitis]
MAKDGKRNGRILLSQQCSIHGPIETHRHKAFVQNITCKKSEITIFIVGRRYDHDDLTEMMKPCEMCPMCGFGSCRMCGHGSCRMCGHTARKISNNWKMNNNPVRCVAAALTDLIHCDNVSTPDNTEERFIVVPIVELPLNYSALNSPEIVYLDGTNQILLRCMNGLTMIFDATFENTSPLATYRLNPNARIIYNKNSGTLAIADSKMLCLRQDYGGTFLLKTALKRPSNKTVFVELPLDEATKFLQIVTNDSDSEDILKQRPALRKFISHLRTTVANIPANTMESVVVETNGKELLEQLRPLEIPGENNNSEVPPEWLTFIWPYISALGERVRLMLNPDHPYNFEYSPEWKGLNKEIMASEAARRLTFQNWPHMEYRWALPCQMAEAGFYHQPNSAGDDRVLCFSCFVCLVCWEPSDEPWSEHERHSPKCRFVHNYTNPNVPLVLTMSALSPFTHHMQVNHTSSLVFSTGSGDWIAVANKESAEVHLWRMGSVVQMKQCISLNSEKFFSAILDCVTIEGDQPPRRTQRVTWSDDLTNCLVNTYVDEAQQVNTIKESSSDECLLKPALTALLIDANCEIVITALCTVGRSCLDDSSIGTVTRESSEQKQTLVIVSISVNDAKLNKVRQQSQGSLETEINTLNTMNRVHEFIDMSPRIVSESCFVDDGINSGASLRPFVVLYQLDCTNSFSSRERISPARQENSKLIRNKMMNSSNANTDSTEGILLTNTTDDTLLEWSDSAYDEHSGFIDLSTGEENLALGGSSKTKYDEKTSYISVNYDSKRSVLLYSKDMIRLLSVSCCIGCEKKYRKANKSYTAKKMPANENTVIPTSFISRISARTSLISAREYKTTVQLLDDNETICQEFKKTSNAQFILDYVCECLNIVEKDYFGLRYQDFSRHRYWMDLNKQIYKQVRGPNVVLRFRVRFYPSDVSVLKEEITRYMLFVQLQRDLLHGRLYCPQTEAAILGALALQSLIGDYDAEERRKNYVAEYRLLFKQTEKLEEKIAESHKLFKGLTPAEAEMEFLKRASKLDTYGFDPYTVVNKQKQTMYIGVTYRGIYIYHISRMIHHITWTELEKVDYVGKEIMITPVSSYVSPYSLSFRNAERATDTLKSSSNLKNGFIKLHKTTGVLKFHCPSAIFAKHLWRHILSQQAFFTENDAKHIKPKFSKPRIPLLTRGSTFRFPTSRVLHEIEVGGSSIRDGPEPTFTRYSLLRQTPRQYVCSIDNKYNSLPFVRSSKEVSEVILENLDEENAVKIDSNTAPMSRVDVLSVAKTSATTTSSGSENTFGISDSGMQLPCEDYFEQMLDAVKPLCASTPTENPNSGSYTNFSTTTTMKMDNSVFDTNIHKNFEKLKCDRSIPATSSLILTNEEKLGAVARRSTISITASAAKIFFSLLLFWLLLVAVAISLFEHNSPWLDSIPALDSVRHMLYEPLRHHILALYVHLGYR